MTDQPQGTMLKIKLKRNDDGTRTLDPHDPMTPLLMATLKGGVLMQLENLLNPEGDDMPTTYDKMSGLPSYELPPATGDEAETMEANQTRERGKDPSRSAGTIRGSYLGADHDDKYMRRQAMEFATKTHSGQTAKMVLDTAQAYLDFLKGEQTTAGPGQVE